jgi:hypothetical protein
MEIEMSRQGTSARMSISGLTLAAVLAGLASSAAAQQQSLSGDGLVAALRQGGYVLLIRHASSPPAPPAASAAQPDNLKLERQLDDKGQSAARAMGASIKALGIRVGAVWSSPTYRALETVRLAELPKPRTTPELGDGGASMQATAASQAEWLQNRVAEKPAPGADTVIVTQLPNIQGAFGQVVTPIPDGEALVFRPEGGGRAEMVGRIKIEEWPVLAGRR